MAEFRDSIDIAAAPETVFEYLTTNDGTRGTSEGESDGSRVRARHRAHVPPRLDEWRRRDRDGLRRRDGKIAESVLIFDRLSFGPPDQGE
ncbi:MAG: hypothetical protein QM611_06670 [Microbacterium sp.]|uniref:hypothetical protein n=1 Tax=Microbacterium sp. TaxID=51671 RepID=UPI0039E2726A